MRKGNDKGFTLVELILVMAISTIIIAALIMIMSTSSMSYQSQESEISVQMEAQAVMNQITNLVIEANNISYDGSNTLTICHLDADPGTFDRKEVIWFDSANRKLYLFHIGDSSKQYDMEEAINHGTKLSDHLLGEYVTSFEVSPDSFVYDRTGKESTTLCVKVEMENGGKAYSVTGNIGLRNRIVDLPTP